MRMAKNFGVHITEKEVGMIKNERMFKLMLAVKRLVYALPDAKLQELEPTLTEIENLISDEMENSIPIERIEQEIDRYIDLGLNSVAKELRTIVDDWRKENEID